MTSEKPHDGREQDKGDIICYIPTQVNEKIIPFGLIC